MRTLRSVAVAVDVQLSALEDVGACFPTLATFIRMVLARLDHMALLLGDCGDVSVGSARSLGTSLERASVPFWTVTCTGNMHQRSGSASSQSRCIIPQIRIQSSIRNMLLDCEGRA